MWEREYGDSPRDCCPGIRPRRRQEESLSSAVTCRDVATGIGEHKHRNNKLDTLVSTQLILCLLPRGLERSIVYSQHAGPTSGIRHALGRDCYLPLLHGLDSFNAICRC